MKRFWRWKDDSSVKVITREVNIMDLKVFCNTFSEIERLMKCWGGRIGFATISPSLSRKMSLGLNHRTLYSWCEIEFPFYQSDFWSRNKILSFSSSFFPVSSHYVQNKVQLFDYVLWSLDLPILNIWVLPLKIQCYCRLILFSGIKYSCMNFSFVLLLHIVEVNIRCSYRTVTVSKDILIALFFLSIWGRIQVFTYYLIIQEVRVRFVGFGAEEDEWVNVKNDVRERSIPLENWECLKVNAGEMMLCLQVSLIIFRCCLLFMGTCFIGYTFWCRNEKIKLYIMMHLFWMLNEKCTI